MNECIAKTHRRQIFQISECVNSKRSEVGCTCGCKKTFKIISILLSFSDIDGGLKLMNTKKMNVAGLRAVFTTRRCYTAVYRKLMARFLRTTVGISERVGYNGPWLLEEPLEQMLDSRRYFSIVNILN